MYARETGIFAHITTLPGLCSLKKQTFPVVPLHPSVTTPPAKAGRLLSTEVDGRCKGGQHVNAPDDVEDQQPVPANPIDPLI